MNPDKKREQADLSGGRIRFIGVVMALAFCVIVLRMWNIQIIHGPEYAQASDKNRLRFQWLRAPRGSIYGRDPGVVLADTRPACDLMLVPADCDDVEEVCRSLERLLGVNADELLEQVKRHERQPYRQIQVKRNVTKTELMRVEERAFALRGVHTVVRPQRRYPYGETAGQIIGYLGEINRDELQTRRPEYKQGDLLGRTGVEQMYEPALRGKDGQLCVVVYNQSEPQLRTDEFGNPVVETDHLGRRLVEAHEFRRDPLPGGPVHLTLDIDLQMRAEEMLRGVEGAIVVLHAETGEVLAMASSPSYSPDVFVRDGYNAERMALLQARPSPMRHRAYQEVYPPGSVFKIMMAIAALEEEGVVKDSSRFGCSGFFRLPGVQRPWRCWRHKYGGHGSVDMVDALAYSCDVYFYNVGLRLGIDKMHEWSTALGLGIVTGLDLPPGVEQEGLIPSTEWKRKQNAHLDRWHQRWYDGETVNASIGQGQIAVTPLQTAVMMAAVINGGKRVRPYLNKDLGPQVTDLDISPKTLEVVIAGMQKCVEKQEAPSGTGRLARIPGMVVLGKTGTAQVIQLKEYPSEDAIPYKERDHAWFIAGVLDREPRIAVSVLVEHGMHGSSAAAPLAKEIIETFYANVPEDLLVARAEETEP